MKANKRHKNTIFNSQFYSFQEDESDLDAEMEGLSDLAKSLLLADERCCELLQNFTQHTFIRTIKKVNLLQKSTYYANTEIYTHR